MLDFAPARVALPPPPARRRGGRGASISVHHPRRPSRGGCCILIRLSTPGHLTLVSTCAPQRLPRRSAAAARRPLPPPDFVLRAQQSASASRAPSALSSSSMQSPDLSTLVSPSLALIRPCHCFVPLPSRPCLMPACPNLRLPPASLPPSPHRRAGGVGGGPAGASVFSTRSTRPPAPSSRQHKCYDMTQSSAHACAAERCCFGLHWHFVFRRHFVHLALLARCPSPLYPVAAHPPSTPALPGPGRAVRAKQNLMLLCLFMLELFS